MFYHTRRDLGKQANTKHGHRVRLAFQRDVCANTQRTGSTMGEERVTNHFVSREQNAKRTVEMFCRAGHSF